MCYLSKSCESPCAKAPRLQTHAQWTRQRYQCLFITEKNYVIHNCEPIRKAIRKEDNKYGGRSVETRVHACEKQFRLGLQKGMEDFPLFLRKGLMMFQ